MKLCLKKIKHQHHFTRNVKSEMYQKILRNIQYTRKLSVPHQPDLLCVKGGKLPENLPW